MILRLMMTFALLTGYSSAGFADPLDTEEPQPGSEEPELPSEPPESGGIRVTPEQCQHAAIQAPLVRAAYDAKILHLNRLWYALGEMHKKYREAGCETNWFLTKNCRVGWDTIETFRVDIIAQTYNAEKLRRWADYYELVVRVCNGATISSSSSRGTFSFDSIVPDRSQVCG